MRGNEDRRGAQAALLALTVLLLFVLTAFQSNTADVERYGPSCLTWLAWRAWDSSGLFSHSLVLPFVSLAIVWRERHALAAAPKRTNRLGLVLLGLALLAQAAGYRMMMPRINLAALLALLWALPLYWYGWPTARIVLFPAAYPLLGIPLDFVDSLTFPLRLVASRVSEALLNGMGVACARVGTMIRMEGAGGFSFDVADPCSGLKYVLAITALSALYAYLMRAPAWKKAFVFCMALPLAVAGNVARIVLIGLAGQFIGREFADGLYHDFSGYIVFGVVIMLMIAMAAVLHVDFAERIGRWKRAHTTRS